MYYFLFSMRLVAMPGGYHENYLSTTLVSFKSVLTDQNCLPSGFMCEFVFPNVLGLRFTKVTDEEIQLISSTKADDIFSDKHV